MLVEFQAFKNKIKIGMLQPDTWVVHSITDKYYRVFYKGIEDIRVVGIIDKELLHNHINTGDVEVLDIIKLKKKKEVKK